VLITLGLFFIAIIVLPILSYIDNDDKGDIFRWGMVSSIVVSIILCLIVWQSYNRYTIIEKSFTNFEQYSEAIEAYTKLAILDTKNAKVNTTEFTDLKYQNYQKGIKDLIEDFRNACMEYNKVLIGKRLYGNNIIFNWLVVMPDKSRKIVKISDFLELKDTN